MRRRLPEPLLTLGLAISVGFLGLAGPSSSTSFADESTMVRLLKSDRVSAERYGTILELIGRRGTQQDVQYIFDRLLDVEGFDSDNRLKAIEALSAASDRGVEPEDRDRLADLIGSAARSAKLRNAAIDLAARWRLEAIVEPLTELVLQADRPLSDRRDTLDNLAAIGGQSAGTALAQLVEADRLPETLRPTAIAALVRVDHSSALSRSLEAIASAKSVDQMAPILTAYLAQPGGPKRLAEAIAAADLPEDAGKLGLRTLYAAGRSDAELVAAFSNAAGLEGDSGPLAPEAMQELIAQVTSHGDPARGELIFRREELNCIKCHAVAGYGGNIGPNLDAIGVSSPVDYLINSILVPEEAVKEAYELMTVLDYDGLVHQGIIVEENDQQVVLKDAEGRITTLLEENIEDSRRGGSLMPKGLTNLITRDEFVDLIAFLDMLGQPGSAYTVGPIPTLRSYRLLKADPETTVNVGISESYRSQVFSARQEDWTPVASRINGEVLLSELIDPADGDRVVTYYLQGALDVRKPGLVNVEVTGDQAEHIWVGDAMNSLSKSRRTLRLKPGRNLVTLRLDLGPETPSDASVKVELIPAQDSEAEVVPTQP